MKNWALHHAFCSYGIFFSQRIFCFPTKWQWERLSLCEGERDKEEPVAHTRRGKERGRERGSKRAGERERRGGAESCNTGVSVSRCNFLFFLNQPLCASVLAFECTIFMTWIFIVLGKCILPLIILPLIQSPKGDMGGCGEIIQENAGRSSFCIVPRR